MLKKVLLLVVVSLMYNGFSQTRINDSFSFDTDPAKKYSLYIPSSYEAGTPNKVMLAFHPFNTSRWDGESWCDTLVTFAETNDLLLICPDGGVDGQIDDPIDTAFTSVLIDSVANWYNLNFDKFYGVGFSWGSRGLYTYGLSHGDLIKGYIPVGAAITGTSEVNEALQVNATGRPFYIVHGSLDAPSSRFYPIRDSLISKGAIVETNLLTGVGHTIDFPNRNEILTIAFNWIDSVNCASLGLNEFILEKQFLKVYPNPTSESIHIVIDREVAQIAVYDLKGNLLIEEQVKTIDVRQLDEGIYIVLIKTKEGTYKTNFVKE